VEIQASGTNAARLDDAIEAAFLAIAQVHRLMSFHDPESELSRINREALYKSVRIHPCTWRVLKCAQEFSRNSNGIFDITMGRQLVEWNYLPKHNARSGSGSWRDIVLEGTCRVRFRKPVVVDLGGIAKGFAVDCAVEALKGNELITGIVNAGGDLRAFGPGSQLVHLRQPTEPTRVAGAVRLCKRAMATSGIYFACKKKRGRWVSPLLDGHTGQAARAFVSVTVGAAECMTADALTKIVFVLRERAAPLLARYSADALVLERDGAPSWMFHPPCDTSRQS
jgi:thiamine biosynthesis lipoprotein